MKKVDLETWKLMMAPARVDLIEAMRVLGRCTVKDLAASLGRAPQAIYPHVQRLIEAGIISQERDRTADGRTAMFIVLTADDFVPDLESVGGDGLNVLAQVTVEALIRSVGINIKRAASKRLFGLQDGQPNSFFMHELIWLNDEQMIEFRDLMRRAKALATKRKQANEGRKYFAVSFLMPAA